MQKRRTDAQDVTAGKPASAGNNDATASSGGERGSENGLIRVSECTGTKAKRVRKPTKTKKVKTEYESTEVLRPVDDEKKLKCGRKAKATNGRKDRKSVV